MIFAVVSKHDNSGMKIDIKIYKNIIEENEHTCDIIIGKLQTAKKYDVKIILEHLLSDSLSIQSEKTKSTPWRWAKFTCLEIALFNIKSSDAK